MRHVKRAMVYDTATDKSSLVHTDAFHLAPQAPMQTRVYRTNNDRLFMTLVVLDPNGTGVEVFEAFLSCEREEVIAFLDEAGVAVTVYEQAGIKFETA